MSGGTELNCRKREWQTETFVSGLADALRGQSLDLPAAVLEPAVAQAVVDAVGTPLPELDDPRGEPVSAPVGRARRLAVTVLLRQRLHSALQGLPVRDDPALVGC